MIEIHLSRIEKLVVMIDTDPTILPGIGFHYFSGAVGTAIVDD
jgi:hypothetical protein